MGGWRTLLTREQTLVTWGALPFRVLCERVGPEKGLPILERPANSPCAITLFNSIPKYSVRNDLPPAPLLWQPALAFHHLQLLSPPALTAEPESPRSVPEGPGRSPATLRFRVVGYVVMPEHFHLLISEPGRGTPSLVMQVLKQRFAHQVLKQRRQRRQRRSTAQLALWVEKEEHLWQRRFYDFNVWSEHKRIEKLRYMHRNPVKRGLVLEPEQWAWSSFRWYASGEAGSVEVNQWEAAELKIRTVA
jgi:REP element-mobilizing transposase RayT